jgi:hypothetical protein
VFVAAKYADDFGLLWDFLLLKYSSGGDIVWSATYDGKIHVPYGQDAEGVASNATGDIYVAGMDRSGPDSDLLICKFRSDGRLDWSVTHDGGADILGDYDAGTGIAVGPDGMVYVTGMCKRIAGTWDITLWKYTSSGTLVWSVTYDGGGDDWGGKRLVVANGFIYVAGCSSNVTDKDAILLKYSTDGVLAGMIRYNSGGEDYAAGVATGPGGDIWLSGETLKDGIADVFLNRYTPDCALIWTMTQEVNIPDPYLFVGGCVTVDSEGGAYVTATRLGAVGWDVHLSKMTPCGQLLWTLTYDGGANEHPTQPVLDGHGNIYITGATLTDKTNIQTSDIMLLKFRIQDSGGCIVSAPSGPAAADECAAIAVTWNTSGAVSGYRLYRATFAGSGKTLLASLGGSASFFLDGAVTAGLTYWYAVTAVLGPTESPPSADVSVVRRGCVPALYTGPVRVYPNPFRRSDALRGTVKFEGVRAGGVLRIYTVRGLLVWERAQTADGVMEWDGRTGEGRPVAPGVYIWVVERAKDRERGKLVVE